MHKCGQRAVAEPPAIAVAALVDVVAGQVDAERRPGHMVAWLAWRDPATGEYTLTDQGYGEAVTCDDEGDRTIANWPAGP